MVKKIRFDLPVCLLFCMDQKVICNVEERTLDQKRVPSRRLGSNMEELKKAGGNCVIRNFTVTDDPVSKPDQGYARRRDRQNYIRKIKYKVGTLNKKNSKLVQYICTLGGCCGKVYDSVCHAEGFSLLLVKGCDHIAALTPFKPKTSSEAFGTHKSDSCFCLIRDVILSETKWGSETILG